MFVTSYEHDMTPCWDSFLGLRSWSFHQLSLCHSYRNSTRRNMADL